MAGAFGVSTTDRLVRFGGPKLLKGFEMIEHIDEGPDTFIVSARYAVLFDRSEAVLLDKLLTHLSLLVHGLGGNLVGQDVAALLRQLRHQYGYNPIASPPADDDFSALDAKEAAVYERVTDECVALIRALAMRRTAEQIHPLAVPSVVRLDIPAWDESS